MKARFSKYGKIASIRFRSGGFSNPKLSKKVNSIKNNFHTQRDSINAYIVFDSEINSEESKTTLQEAVQENGTLFFDKHIRVDSQRNENHTNYKRTIFVGNLPLNIADEELRTFFVEGTGCGDEGIENVRVVRDREYSIGKGFGFVTFKVIILNIFYNLPKGKEIP